MDSVEGSDHDATSSEGSAEREVLRFLSRYTEDVAEGRSRTLTEYLALFPLHAEAIAREYLALRETEGAASGEGEGGAGSAAIAPESPEAMPRYELIRELGRGGQGIVHLAEDRRLKRRVALKILDRSQTLRSQALLARFRREAEAASRLDHPGICQVYDWGSEGEHTFIAMRYVEGETLAQRIAAASAPAAGSREDVERAVVLVEKAARALDASHEAGVLHRDVKPGNLMVTPEGEPVLLDFGLARDEESDAPTLTRSAEVMGTPAYMSPEQIAGGSRVDRRTDVYALGVVLYEALTLRRPFEGPTREALVRAISSEPPPDPRRLNPSIDADLAVILETALEKDLGRRYQTALDLAEDLRRWRVREPIRARPAGPVLRLRRWAQRRPAVATLLLAIVLFFGAGTIWTAAKNRQLGNTVADLERLTDSRLVRAYVEEQVELPASRPQDAARIKVWIEKADPLASRLSIHRTRLEEVRLSALPYDDHAREHDRTTHPRSEELLTLEMQIEGLKRKKEPFLDATLRNVIPLVDRDELVRLVRTRRAELRAAVNQRRTWKFTSPIMQWQHDTLAELVVGLEGLTEPRSGTLSLARRKRDFVLRVREITIDSIAEKWAEAIASIADPTRCPAYSGLRVVSQLGLVPLGRDSASGLWEFAHPCSGGVPVRGEDGKLRMTEQTGLVFVLIPGGAFDMGARRPDDTHPLGSPNVDPNAHSSMPIHRVALDPFFLSKFEMTQGQWERLTGQHPSTHREGVLVPYRVSTLLDPVNNVTWEQCSELLGPLGLRLPTEAQWEYAARARTTTVWWTGNDLASLRGAANINDRTAHLMQTGWGRTPEDIDDGYAVHAPVGSHRPNVFGLHEVIGNVSEWVQDNHGSYASPASPGDGERGEPKTSWHMHRGGSFTERAASTGSAARGGHPPRFRDMATGVRPARRLEK